MRKSVEREQMIEWIENVVHLQVEKVASTFAAGYEDGLWASA